MNKYIVDGAPEADQPVHLSLKLQPDGEVRLMARVGDVEEDILRIHPNGEVYKVAIIESAIKDRFKTERGKQYTSTDFLAIEDR